MKFLLQQIPTAFPTSPSKQITKQRQHRPHSSKTKKKYRSTSSSLSLSGAPSSQTKVPFSSQNTEHYEFEEGETLAGSYKIARLLGDGTFGRVVEAITDNKRYAIKIIRPVEKYIESAKIEKEILKSINRRDKNDQEGIVRYKHSFYHRGHFCLVFKPLGPSLYDIIKKNQYRGFNLKTVQSFFKQILKSIGFLHRIGYTHTDLKPENILLERQELILDSSKDYNYYQPQSTRIKVIDFGGATKHGQMHSPVICTRQYRPPEVILECCEWNEIADVWSIGCIIAELFTGDLLYPTHSDYEHLVMIEKNCGKFPHWMVSKTPSALRKIFLDGWISESEVQKHLENWQNVRALRTISQIFSDCESLGDLVRSCLQVDPNRRINCMMALRHRFFQIKFE